MSADYAADADIIDSGLGHATMIADVLAADAVIIPLWRMRSSLR